MDLEVLCNLKELAIENDNENDEEEGFGGRQTQRASYF